MIYGKCSQEMGVSREEVGKGEENKKELLEGVRILIYRLIYREETMKRYLAIIMAVIFMACTSTTEQATQKIEDFNAYGVSGEVTDGVREIDVEAVKYKFNPAIIVVNSGEKVKIRLNSADAAHGFAVEEIGFDLKGEKGMVTEKEFTAPAPGVYVIKCSVYCGLGHNNMAGTLVVK